MCKLFIHKIAFQLFHDINTLHLIFAFSIFCINFVCADLSGYSHLKIPLRPFQSVATNETDDYETY